MKQAIKYRKNVCIFYTAFIFTALPLAVSNKYFNISTVKWVVFLVGSIGFIAVTLLAYLLDPAPAKKKKSFVKPRTKFGFIEFTLLAFFASNLLAFIFSVNRSESFTGIDSRHHGFLNIIIYFLVFLIIAKNPFDHLKLFILMAVIGGLVSLTAVVQFIGIDPLGFYSRLTVASAHRMISTVGNMNIFSSYLNMVTPLTILFFIKEKEKKKQLLYGICLTLDFAAGIASVSDGFYLGTAVGIFMILCCAKLSRREFGRMFLAGTIISFTNLLYVLLVNYIDKKHIIISKSFKKLDMAVRDCTGITKLLREKPFILLITFCIFCLSATTLFFLFRGQKGEKPLLPQGAAKLILIAGVLCAATLIIVIIAQYPYKNETASYRGYIWNLTIKDYNASNIFRKLIGYGQETVGQRFISLYRAEMKSVTGVVYDNVHCEPLQYLITTGLLGMLSYLALIFSIFAAAVKTAFKENENLAVMIIFVPAVSYFSQSVINIAQSNTTPIYFLLLAILYAKLKNNH